MARRTSVGVRPNLFRRAGSSQIRIAYCEPNTTTSPTPVTRDSGSCTLETRKSVRSKLDLLPSSATKPITIRKLRADLATCTPCCCTAWGSSGSASCSLFCTCTWAMSGLVSGEKVSVIVARPKESLDELKYSSPSSPVIFCSMTWVTESSTALADAPGYCALIAIAGGAMAGYCDTGSFRMDSAPASMMTMAMTHAKMGRSMKNLAMVCSSARLAGADDAHLGPRPDALQAIDHDT